MINGDMGDALLKAKVIVDQWVNYYNKVRPHSALGRRQPALAAAIPAGRLCENEWTVTL